jgi:hypothetical protein
MRPGRTAACTVLPARWRVVGPDNQSINRHTDNQSINPRATSQGGLPGDILHCSSPPANPRAKSGSSWHLLVPPASACDARFGQRREANGQRADSLCAAPRSAPGAHCCTPSTPTIGSAAVRSVEQALWARPPECPQLQPPRDLTSDERQVGKRVCATGKARDFKSVASVWENGAD